MCSVSLDVIGTYVLLPILFTRYSSSIKRNYIGCESAKRYRCSRYELMRLEFKCI